MKKKFIKNKSKNKVALLVFYGRKKYSKMLFRYIFRDLKCNGGIVDKIFIFKNTYEESDLHFLSSLQKGKFGKYIEIISGVRMGISGYSESIDWVNEKCGKEWFIIKIDDDIVYIKSGSIENLVNFTGKNKTICSGNVVNSSHCNFIHERIGALPIQDLQFHPEKDYASSGFLPRPKFNLYVHNNFLRLYDNKLLSSYYFDKFVLPDSRWSINVICWNPSYLSSGEPSSSSSGEPSSSNGFKFCQNAPGGDEVGVSCDWPKYSRKCCLTCGGGVFVHWAFGFQRADLDGTSEGQKIYDSYIKICNKETDEYYEI
jgi:hypothetical protein